LNPWVLRFKIFLYAARKLFSRGDFVCDIQGCGKRAGNILDFFWFYWNKVRGLPYEWAIKIEVPPGGEPGSPTHISLCPVHKQQVFATILRDREIDNAIYDTISKLERKKPDVIH
jgi:hypothetical protein